MAKPGPKIDPEKAARILVDAADLGDRAAARRHDVSIRTVQNYREKYRGDPIVAELCAELQKTLREDWLGSARETRRKLLALVWDRAVESKSLWQVAGAYKVLDDSIRTEEAARKGREEGQAPGEFVFRIDVSPPLEDADSN
jgi:hypothetical protein